MKIGVPQLALSGELRTGGCCSGGFSQCPGLWARQVVWVLCVLSVHLSQPPFAHQAFFHSLAGSSLTEGW